MSPRSRVNATKKEIIQVATKMFMEKGFSETTIKSICDEIQISTGNLTFHYPTKEHLLAVLVKMLCGFQWREVERFLDEGSTTLQAVCAELPAMVSICGENAIAKDFYLSAYTYPMTMEIIRRNDIERSKRVYEDYCQNWTEEQFIAAENLVSGIEYATLMDTQPSVDMNVRISGALNLIQQIYGVPQEVREQNIAKVLKMDYAELGRRVLRDFTEYVHEISEWELEKLLLQL